MTNSSRPSQSILKAAGEGGRRQLTQAEAVVVLLKKYDICGGRFHEVDWLV
ncbi:DUF3387 domain-containing protein [Nitrospirales bacterium NOB]|nr:MAG: hypothetical protein UZ03_NOB001003396 [Nitrospira sp. OLB3]MBV6471181.1 hypothetical protein [Nitrospirota bacterium]MDL1889090.1 DUF3387 domain-containing protein [Nitrospirales bacterium NOB]QOJ35214.1 MAG: hypothetical protein HRU82_09745 [Nitrospira sp.]